MTDLASVLIGDPNDGTERQAKLRTGVVTQASPLLVRVGSATTAKPANALGAYTPLVGDTVNVLVVPGDRLVLGSVRPTGARAAITTGAGGDWGAVSSTGIAILAAVGNGAPQVAIVSMNLLYTPLSAGTAGDFELLQDGSLIARSRYGDQQDTAALTIPIVVPAGGSVLILRVQSNVGTVRTYADPTFNYLAVTTLGSSL